MRVSSLSPVVRLMSNEVGLLSATVYCPWLIDFPLSYYVQEGYGVTACRKEKWRFRNKLVRPLTDMPLPVTSFFAA